MQTVLEGTDLSYSVFANQCLYLRSISKMGYSILTLKKLFVLSGNICAFPNCTAPIFDVDSEVMVGEICHIKGKSPNGPRYDPNQTEDERDGYENLILMCGAHNKIIDDRKTRDKFTVHQLRQYKSDHEAKTGRTVVSDELAQKFVSEVHVEGSIIQTFNQTGGQTAHSITNYINQPSPARQVNLSLKFDHLITKVDHFSGEDYYDFRVTLCNDGPTTIRDFRLDIDIPNYHLNQFTNYLAEVESRRTTNRRLFRMTPDKFGGITLYSGDCRNVFNIGLLVTKQQYIEGVTDSILLSLFYGDELIYRVEQPISEILNKERVQDILGK